MFSTVLEMIATQRNCKRSGLPAERAKGKHLEFDQSLVYIPDSMLTWPLFHLSSYDAAFLLGSSNCYRFDANINSGNHI